MRVNPKERISPAHALTHPFFDCRFKYNHCDGNASLPLAQTPEMVEVFVEEEEDNRENHAGHNSEGEVLL